MDGDLIFRDPVDRFRAIVGSAGTAARPKPVGTELSAASIGRVIETERAANATAGDVSAAVTRHVAMNSNLTEAAAAAVVAPVLAAAPAGSPEVAAQAVSDAVATSGLAGNVGLSDPAMLGPLPRLVAGGLLGAVAILTVVYEFHLPATAVWGAYVGLMVTGILSVLGLLVLVMGYRSVTISGSAAPPG